MFKEFGAFVARGNVLDLAVGVIIGAAFGTIVASLTDDIIMPFISLITGGGVDFSNMYAVLAGSAPDGASLAEAKKTATVLAYGNFVTKLINFLILAFIIFLIVRKANEFFAKMAPPAGPTEVDLLTEIRDSLKK
jgi:large conductance mechanosensitive channel